ncbi:hypothetical protein CH063_14752 [Colletotrichum higginsianum]|uniref:Uncharacterized protein n=1 Tax=Colletotrichum higginsianum (strain IMI 349063) TaxID=759273 RepID=H1VZY2_COLHI|nr:hypothetical protein CH063_14752 [Colletotrichum higginsianum]
MADTPDPTDQAILQYAPDWYQDNSREFPSHSLDDDPDNDDKKKNKKDSKNNNEDEDEDEDEDDDNDEDDNDDDDDTKDDNDDDSDNSTDKIIKTATRSHDKSVQTNASQRQGDQHAPLFVPQPPAKFANHGQWEFIEFVPGWTDPIWDGHETVKIDDHHKHLVVGDYIVKQAEIHAAAAGAEDVEALLETYSRLTPGGESRQPSATEQFDWQSLVFSGLTTQELLDDGILSLKNTYGCNLENDLHG